MAFLLNYAMLLNSFINKTYFKKKQKNMFFCFLNLAPKLSNLQASNTAFILIVISLKTD